ncbi:hypothetical protein GCM10027614_11390 [Micromonospora vulcania]
MNGEAMGTGGRSVYGLWVYGLDEVAELSTAGGSRPGQPVVLVRQVTDQPPPPPVPLDNWRGTRVLADGRTLAVDRLRGTATFYGPPLTPDVLAHPYLAPVATTVNRWAGRETFHSGAFVLDGRAWAVLGPRTAGKSSLLAALAAWVCRCSPTTSWSSTAATRSPALAASTCGKPCRGGAAHPTGPGR